MRTKVYTTLLLAILTILNCSIQAGVVTASAPQFGENGAKERPVLEPGSRRFIFLPPLVPPDFARKMRRASLLNEGNGISKAVFLNVLYLIWVENAYSASQETWQAYEMALLEWAKSLPGPVGQSHQVRELIRTVHDRPHGEPQYVSVLDKYIEVLQTVAPDSTLITHAQNYRKTFDGDQANQAQGKEAAYKALAGNYAKQLNQMRPGFTGQDLLGFLDLSEAAEIEKGYSEFLNTYTRFFRGAEQSAQVLTPRLIESAVSAVTEANKRQMVFSHDCSVVPGGLGPRVYPETQGGGGANNGRQFSGPFSPEIDPVIHERKGHDPFAEGEKLLQEVMKRNDWEADLWQFPSDHKPVGATVELGSGSKKETFRVMSLNVAMDNAVTRAGLDSGLDDGLLHKLAALPSAREAAVFRVIHKALDSGTDVICLQDVEPALLQRVQAKLNPDTYGVVGVGDRVLIFRKGKFEVTSSGDQHPHKRSYATAGIQTVQLKTVLDGNRVTFKNVTLPSDSELSESLPTGNDPVLVLGGLRTQALQALPGFKGVSRKFTHHNESEKREDHVLARGNGLKVSSDESHIAELTTMFGTLGRKLPKTPRPPARASHGTLHPVNETPFRSHFRAGEEELSQILDKEDWFEDQWSFPSDHKPVGGLVVLGAGDSEETFRVMSLNVRKDHEVERSQLKLYYDNIMDGLLYNLANKSHARKAALFRVIRKALDEQTGVICLQDVEPQLLRGIQATLDPAEFGVVASDLPSESNQGHHVLIYRKDRFDLQDRNFSNEYQAHNFTVEGIQTVRLKTASGKNTVTFKNVNVQAVRGVKDDKFGVGGDDPVVVLGAFNTATVPAGFGHLDLGPSNVNPRGEIVQFDHVLAHGNSVRLEQDKDFVDGLRNMFRRD